MNASYIRSLFNQARRAGYTASDALSIARTANAFDDAINEGIVKIEAVPDDTYEPDGEADRKAYERDGAWGVVTSYQSESGRWEVADSVWGFVGYRDVLDPIENGYVADMMRAALDAVPDPAAMI